MRNKKRNGMCTLGVLSVKENVNIKREFLRLISEIIYGTYVFYMLIHSLKISLATRKLAKDHSLFVVII